eukprot:SAG31_NODE_1768_length_7313_cov_3.691295_4_plen_960_part_00
MASPQRPESESASVEQPAATGGRRKARVGRRRSILDGASSVLSGARSRLKSDPEAPQAPSSKQISTLLVDASQADLESSLSSNQLAVLNRIVQDESLPAEALKTLAMSCDEASSHAAASIVEWLRRQLDEVSPMPLKHRALVTLHALVESSPQAANQLCEHAAALARVESLQNLAVTSEPPSHGELERDVCEAAQAVVRSLSREQGSPGSRRSLRLNVKGFGRKLGAGSKGRSPSPSTDSLEPSEVTPQEELTAELQFLSHKLSEQWIDQATFDAEKKKLVAKYGSLQQQEQHHSRNLGSEKGAALKLEANHKRMDCSPEIDRHTAMAALAAMFPTVKNDEIEAALNLLDPYTAEEFLRKKHGLQQIEGSLSEFVARMERRKQEREEEKSTPRSKLRAVRVNIVAAQKQKLAEAKKNMEQLYAARMKASVEVGPLTKDIVQKLFACTADSPCDPAAVEELAKIAATADQPLLPEQMTQWLISRLEDESGSIQYSTLTVLYAFLESQRPEVETTAEEFRATIERLAEAAEDGNVRSLANAAIKKLGEARQRILDGRRRRREQAAERKVKLKQQAKGLAVANGIEESVMLHLLEATANDGKEVAELEAVMGLSSALQNAAVHAQIKNDMSQYNEENPDDELWMWAKSSAWAADTGGELDENGAPIRAQTGLWLQMWLSVKRAAAETSVGNKPPQEDVPLLATPQRILEWLGALLVSDARRDVVDEEAAACSGASGAVTERAVASTSSRLLKVLDVLKGLALADFDFRAALIKGHAVSVGALQQYTAPPGDESARLEGLVRSTATELYEELFPDARASRLRREAEQEESRKKEASIKGKIGQGLRRTRSVTAGAVSLATGSSETEDQKLASTNIVLAAVSQKNDAIFKTLDVDLDGFLNYSELSQLAVRTGGDLSEPDYAMVCSAAGCDAQIGLTKAGLLRVYTDLRLGNVDKDHKALGLGS